MINLLMVNIPQTESIIAFLRKQGEYRFSRYDNDPFVLLDILRRRSFDIIITTDLTEKKFDTIKMVRKYSPLSVIIHISKVRDSNEVARAFKAGAHDYLRMPFNYSELHCRIMAKYNRFCAPKNGNILEFGGCELLLDSSRLKISDAIIMLTSKEFDLLEVFFREPNKIFRLDDLQVKVYHDSGKYIQKCFNNILMRVRKKLSFNPKVEIRYIKKQGYALLAK